MDIQPLDRCDQCGFDGHEWDDRDTIKTIGLLPQLVRLWSGPVRAADLNNRPEAEVWSVAEYLDHVRETLFNIRFVVDLALHGDDKVPDNDLGPDIEPAPAGPHRQLDVDEVLIQLDEEAAQLVTSLRAVGDSWNNGVTIGGRLHTIAWAARHAVHDSWHHLTDIASIASGLRAEASSEQGVGRGVVHQINRSSGGVPKTAVPTAEIGRRGLVGDVQAARAHHGRPWQAVSLWSSDVIEALVAEGHPIVPGAAGENLTLAGLDWSTLQAGAILEIGPVRLQLSAPAVPCAKNNQWFADGDSRRMDHDLHPGWSRWYATVLTPGPINEGDTVNMG